jgi:mercuric ion binding protein
MNRIVKVIVAVALLGFLDSSAKAQESKEVITDTLQVSGICGMCEERIENAALIKGVKKAEWSVDQQSLIVVYRSDKTSMEEVARAIANAGHDNGLITSTDEEYDQVHNCCKYRETNPH